jgi:hypothetical protein
VKHVFDRFRPQVVIIEGVANTGEVSPRWYLDYCKEEAKSGYAKGGEASYSAALAAERKIDFIPGEPSARTMYEGIAQQGFTIADLLGWKIAVELQAAASSAGRLRKADAAKRAETAARELLNELGKAKRSYDFSKFCDWYKHRMGEPFSPRRIGSLDCSPSTAPGANFVQRMMAATDSVREPHIVRMIAIQLSKHDRVLAVFGSGHLYKQEPVLAKLLGPAVHSKPF